MDIIYDLKKFYGLPPHNDPGNICRNDMYFLRSLQEKYSRKELDSAQIIIDKLIREYYWRK